MKTILLFGVLFYLNSFAGTAVQYTNDALGFTFIDIADQDFVEVCDAKFNCMQFNPLKTEEQTRYFQESTGKCEIAVTQFNKSFGSGKTKNEFMLDIGLKVVEVIKGEENCTLQQGMLKKQRSITGIYSL